MKRQDAVCYMLVRFGKFEHIKALQDNGTIYVNPISYFKTLDNDNCVRADENENLTHVLQADKHKAWVNDDEVKLVPGSQIKIFDPREEVFPATHIFCMSSIFEGDELAEPNIFDPRINEFVSAPNDGGLLVITDPKEFLDRVINNAPAGIELNWGRVRYVDPKSHNGKLTVLNKFEGYSWQKEFRIAFAASNKVGPLSYQIGDISDISKLTKYSDFKNKFSSLTNEITFS